MFKSPQKPYLALLAALVLIFSACIALAEERNEAQLSQILDGQRLERLIGSKTALSFSHRLLGAGSLHISSLALDSRSTAADSSNRAPIQVESIYLGQGVLSLRRGIPKQKSQLRKIKVALAAQLESKNGQAPYLRLHFSRVRGAGRVFEITLPLNGQTGTVRNVSLRALSSKVCGFDGLEAPSSQAWVSEHGGATSSSTLRSNTPQTSAAQLKIFTVTTDCDFECYAKLGGIGANNKIVEFFNAASTIYAGNLGYGLKVVSQIARPTAITYPTLTTESDRLLDLFLAKAPSLGSADFKHLITGKTMKENVVGLSYVGVACRQPSYAVGYSQHISNLLTPIIIAHEIGHNFNALHDPNNSGIMSARLDAPYPSAFSQLSKTEITSYVNGLGKAACFDLGTSSSRSSLSSSSSTSTSSISSSSSSTSSSSSAPNPGGGTDAGDSFQATLSTKLKGSTFSAALTQPAGSNCTVSLRVARNESGLSANSASYFSSAISNTEKISLMAGNMPKVQVNKAGKKALVWFQVVSTCSEAESESDPRSLNLAVEPSKAKGRKMLKNTKAWINLLKSSLLRE